MNPLGSFSLFLLFFIFIAFKIFLIYFSFYFWCSNFSSISLIPLLPSITPLYPSALLLLFCYFFGVSFPHFPLLIHYQYYFSSPFSFNNHFSFLWSSHTFVFPLPFPYSSISLFSYVIPCSPGVDNDMVGRRICLFWCCFVLFCFVL